MCVWGGGLATREGPKKLVKSPSSSIGPSGLQGYEGQEGGQGRGEARLYVCLEDIQVG